MSYCRIEVLQVTSLQKSYNVELKSFKYSFNLPAVGVVSVEGKVVGEPVVDVVESQLVAGRGGEGLQQL